MCCRSLSCSTALLGSLGKATKLMQCLAASQPETHAEEALKALGA